MTDKELRSLYNFYKNSEKGFVTRDGYAAIPSDGKKVGVVYMGEILKFCRNEDSAHNFCLLYTSPSPRDLSTSRMPSSA